MKAIILTSSARSNGNTAIIAEQYKQNLENHSVTVEIVNLSLLSIGICKGCRTCFNKGEIHCPLKDDVLGLLNKILEANLVIIASPVYVEDVNGVLKNWIDRMAFNCHRPLMYKQKVFAIVNSGSGASRHALKTIERACQTWGMRIIGERKYILGARIKKEEFEEKYSETVIKDSKRILEIMKTKQNPTFLQIMTFYIQQWYYMNKEDKTTYDYRYWEEKKWLDGKTNYYYKAKVNPIKLLFSRIFGRIIIQVILR